jgi:hypothetical protein
VRARAHALASTNTHTHTHTHTRAFMAVCRCATGVGREAKRVGGCCAARIDHVQECQRWGCRRTFAATGSQASHASRQAQEGGRRTCCQNGCARGDQPTLLPLSHSLFSLNLTANALTRDSMRAQTKPRLHPIGIASTRQHTSACISLSARTRALAYFPAHALTHSTAHAHAHHATVRLTPSQLGRS